MNHAEHSGFLWVRAVIGMLMSDYLSNKFKWLAFFATWAVVGIHSRTFRWSETTDWTNAVQNEICKGFNWAVPVFFIIAGYLLLASYEKHGYVGLLKRKFWSLYVPCVCWMLISEIVTLPIAFYLKELPSLRILIYAPLFAYEKLSISYHLWFVRDLLMVSLLVPVFFWLAKTECRAWAAFFCSAFCVCFFDCPAISVGPYTIQYYSMTIPFVFLGMALYRSNRFVLSGGIPRRILACCFCIFVLATTACWLFTSGNEFLFRMSLVGVVWFGYDLLAKGKSRDYPLALPSVFVIYCMHLIVIRYISGAGRVICGNGAGVKMLFFALHGLSFWLCLYVVDVTRRRVPPLYYVLSGGR